MDALVLVHSILVILVLTSQCDSRSNTVALFDNRCYRLKDDLLSVDSAFKEKVPVSRTIDVNNTVRVLLSRNHIQFGPEEQYYCKIRFTTNRVGYRMLLSWENFSVGENRGATDWFQVVDLQSGLPLSNEMWGVMGQGINRRPPSTNDYHSISHGLVLNYKGHPYHDALAVIITVFKDLNAEYSCDLHYMKCQGRKPICISEKLKCNGDNNCGDSNRSDEDSSCNRNPWIGNKGPPVVQSSVPVGLIGALCGIFVTGALITVVGCLICWHKRRQNRMCWSEKPNSPRGIESLAQADRETASNNTYTPLPISSKALSGTENHCIMDFSHHGGGLQSRSRDDSSEPFILSSRNETPGVNNNSTYASDRVMIDRRGNGEPAVLYSNDNQDCTESTRDGQIYYDMDDIAPAYEYMS